MTTFDQREDSFEKKIAHDEELKFKAEARRNKLVGLWAAEKLGLSGTAADAYAREVIGASVTAAGGRAVANKLIADLAAKDVSESAIQHKMAELLAVATAQI